MVSQAVNSPCISLVHVPSGSRPLCGVSTPGGAAAVCPIHFRCDSYPLPPPTFHHGPARSRCSLGSFQAVIGQASPGTLISTPERPEPHLTPAPWSISSPALCPAAGHRPRRWRLSVRPPQAPEDLSSVQSVPTSAGAANLADEGVSLEARGHWGAAVPGPPAYPRLSLSPGFYCQARRPLDRKQPQMEPDVAAAGC